jgi:hypothetical protein
MQIVTSFLIVVFCLQVQIIGQIDDVMKLGKCTLLFNSCEPLTLNITLNWSQNIRAERLSDMDFVWFDGSAFLFSFKPCCLVGGGDEYGLLLFGSHCTNSTLSSLLDKIFSNELFRQVRAVGLLGTHSICKGVASYAACFGMILDWICSRG